MAEKKYELKDKATGFFDHETGFKIVRDQQTGLGKTVGGATTEAIQHGRLIEVRTAEDSKPAASEGDKSRGKAEGRDK